MSIQTDHEDHGLDCGDYGGFGRATPATNVINVTNVTGSRSSPNSELGTRNSEHRTSLMARVRAAVRSRPFEASDPAYRSSGPRARAGAIDGSKVSDFRAGQLTSGGVGIPLKNGCRFR